MSKKPKVDSDEVMELYTYLPEGIDLFEGEPLSKEIWHNKYRFGSEAAFAATSARVVKGVYEKDPSKNAADNAYRAMSLGLWMPGGRIIAGAGTGKRVTLFNCFDEQEFLITRDGIINFHDAQGPTEVLTQKGWIEADIRQFGVQKVQKYTFAPRTKDGRGGQSQYRREVLATPDHRWILTTGKETTSLDIGMRVPACAYNGEVNQDEYQEGVKHGIIFGDGMHTRTTLREVTGGYPLGTMHFAVRLCGAKADYLPLFEGARVTHPPSSKGDPHVFLHTKVDLKAVPLASASVDYIKGFIDGWAAMDGGSSVAGANSKAIFSKNRTALDWLCTHAPLAGYIPVGNRRFSSGETNYGGEGELWVATIREVAFVEWECVGIAEYGNRPVMCAVVPEEAAFTLAGGIYTGNCYVNETIHDSMEGIHRGYGNVMFTMQQGGGIGTDFTPIRPDGAWLMRTQAPASGPLPFMVAQDSIGRTVESAGERRGAQMGTLADFHPDLPKFITAKHEAGVLTQFNLSILVSDAFMSAVAEDEDWLLYHTVAPLKRDPELEALDFVDDYTGEKAYVYSVWRARDLWEKITRSTYEYSEPGVIFIDRVNELNNLYYREQIRCTNPCVTGDTLILTNEGHRPIKDLVGKPTTIWNGFEWSEVVPFSTGINPLMELTFSNGQTVRCTPYHKWVLKEGSRVEAKDLRVNDQLIYTEMPIVPGELTYHTDAYSQGFYCGDGTKNATESNLYKHEEGIRNRLVGKIWNRNCVSQPGYRWKHGVMLPKNFVPSEGTQEYCINWLAGYLDADGCCVKKFNSYVLEASAKDRDFLQRLGHMLNRFGVNYRIWERKDAGLKNGSNSKAYMCESTAALMISMKGVHQLVSLGLRCERVNLQPFQYAPKGVAKVGHKVKSIRHLQHMEETFCFTEPKRNMGIFNGTPGSNCGEQPLPPNACCNLGAANVALMVKNPFTDEAVFDFDLLAKTVHIGTRFLDNVTDVTKYPLEAQRIEQEQTRRIGLGLSGLSTSMAFMGIRYGSSRSARFAGDVMRAIAFNTYLASSQLAEERGAFPAYNEEAYWGNSNSFAATHWADTPFFGRPLRNGVMNTLAPTGTTSVAYGNVDSSLEPIWALEYDRNVRQRDDTYKKSRTTSLTARVWKHLYGEAEYPKHIVLANQLKVHEHILVQEACQQWVDASISKTINIPKEMSYEEFVQVYDLAYEAGLKGCTTYRPSEMRGSILVTEEEEETKKVVEKAFTQVKRPSHLSSITSKVPWPALNSPAYITLSRLADGSPFEVFLNSKDQRNTEWMTTATLFLSWLLRAGIPLTKLAEEMEQVHSLDGYIVDGRYRPSLVSFIGTKLKEMEEIYQATLTAEDTPSNSLQLPPATRGGEDGPEKEVTIPEGYNLVVGKRCRYCNSPRIVSREGCEECIDCGNSKCS